MMFMRLKNPNFSSSHVKVSEVQRGGRGTEDVWPESENNGF